MSNSIIFWNAVFFVLCAALLLLPFYPAWREWRHPLDALALRLESSGPEQLLPSSSLVHLTADAASPPVVRAGFKILVNPGCHFRKLIAPTIVLGNANPEGRNFHPEIRRTALTTLPGADPWGDHGWRIRGDCHIADAHHVHGSLVVMGSLSLGADCVVDGDIKAHGAVLVGPRCHICGALFSEQAIVLHDDATAQGPVVSEVRVDLGPRVVVGRPDHFSTLSAPQLVANAGAVVHGTVWALQFGRVA